MKHYFQLTIVSKTLRYLAQQLETALNNFPDAWYHKYVPNTGGLLTLLTRLCDLRDWLFKKSIMFDPKQIVCVKNN